MGMSVESLSLDICKAEQYTLVKLPAWRTMSIARKLLSGCCVALGNLMSSL